MIAERFARRNTVDRSLRRYLSLKIKELDVVRIAAPERRAVERKEN
jgi:hypothetical protein